MCKRRMEHTGPDKDAKITLHAEHQNIIRADPSVAWFDNPLPPLYSDGTPVDLELFNSELGEDQILLTKFFCDTHGGFFVEVGAHDGNLFSNSKFFQEFMNWKGVLIEPLQEPYEKLRSSWRCAQGTQCLPFAICKDFQSVDFIGEKRTAGIASTHSTLQKNGWNTFKVPCGPISPFLKMAGVTHIDLLSIDIEGGEIGVIETMDWSIPVHVVVVEQEGVPDAKSKRINQILLDNGFRFYGKIGSSSTTVFANPNYKQPMEHELEANTG